MAVLKDVVEELKKITDMPSGDQRASAVAEIAKSKALLPLEDLIVERLEAQHRAQ